MFWLHADTKALSELHRYIQKTMRKKSGGDGGGVGVECPVCLEVPKSGPVSVCPNGHLVCSECKTRTKTCPTCRAKIQGRSLLAETVMENIEHKCNYEGCEVRLDLKDLGAHMKKCLQRVVKCPSPHKFCGKEMPLRSLYDHIIHECLGSLNAWVDDGVFDNVFPMTWECKTDRSGEGCALCFQGVYFYLSIESASDTDVHVFSVELFGTAAECKDYEVCITTVHKGGDEEMKGKKCPEICWGTNYHRYETGREEEEWATGGPHADEECRSEG